jgi:hypothetical protein
MVVFLLRSTFARPPPLEVAVFREKVEAMAVKIPPSAL